MGTSILVCPKYLEYMRKNNNEYDVYPYALLVNDLHIGKDNIAEFHKNWSEALSICEKQKISNIIIGGDLWLSRSSQSLNTLLAVRNAINEAWVQKIYVTIAGGNHCKVDQESSFHYGHIFSEYPNVKTVCFWEENRVNDVSLWTMSYFPENGSFVKRLETLLETIDENRYNILYAHQGINGGLSTPTEDELPVHLFDKFDRVLVGHYHDRCKIEGTNIEYIGSSRQHNFGEDEEKGYTVLYSDGTTEFIKNKANIRYKTIELEAKDLSERTLEKISKLTQDSKYLVKTKINCKDSEVDLIDKNKLIEAGVSKVEVITESMSVKINDQKSLETRFDKSGVKNEYTSFCNKQEIKNVELGLKYLDKIK